MFWYKTPQLIQRLFPELIWRQPGGNNTIHLTFDDGPVPQATPMVLHYLRMYQAKATFFCVGDNIDKHPQVLEELLADGHRIGNHTQHHLDGWQTSKAQYIDNVLECQYRIDRYVKYPGQPLFRPPYGRIKPGQKNALLPTNTIIMWDVLSGDFSKNNPVSCLNKTTSNTQPGSIVVFHDSLKTIDKLNFVLPRFLRYFSAQGFIFEAL